jgi:hypothetical protein
MKVPDNASAGKTDSTLSGAGVTSQINVGSIKPVGHRTVEGSRPGDHRAAKNGNDVTAFAKESPGPRDAKGQARTSKYNVDSPADPIKGGSGSAESE